MLGDSFLEHFSNLGSYEILRVSTSNETRSNVLDGEVLVGLHIKKEFTKNILSSKAYNIVPMIDVYADTSEAMTTHQTIADLYREWHDLAIGFQKDKRLKKIESFSKAVSGKLGTKFRDVFGAGVVGTNVIMTGLVIGVRNYNQLVDSAYDRTHFTDKHRIVFGLPEPRMIFSRFLKLLDDSRRARCRVSFFLESHHPNSSSEIA